MKGFIFGAGASLGPQRAVFAGELVNRRYAVRSISLRALLDIAS